MRSPIPSACVRLRLWSAAVALVAVVSTPEAGHGQSQRRCRQRVAAAGEEFVARTAAVLAACGARAGSAATDCQMKPKTRTALDAAVRRLDRRIRRWCTDALVSTMLFGADCRGVGSAADLSACIQTTHAAEVGRLVEVLDVDEETPPAAGRRCLARVAREARRFLTTTLRLLQRCKAAAARGRLPIGTDCRREPETAARIAGYRARAARRIEAGCGAGGLEGLTLGVPCAAPATGAAVVACVLSVAAAAGDGAALAAHGDGGVCGDAHPTVEARIDALLPELTLAEKVAQMHGLQFLAIDGLFHTPDNERLGIPGFRMVDGPRGVRAGNATSFPAGMARGATWDPVLEERVGEAMGTETRAKGGSVLLAPLINLLRHPLWGRAQETYGEDPLHVGTMGVGLIRGAQRQVVASAKALALNSIETDRLRVNVSVDERTLREVYLPHFRMAVQDADVGSVMSAYNKVNGRYCAENVSLLRRILKGEWGFRGFVESDWIFGMWSTAPSAIAGLDVEMPAPFFYGPELVAAVENGEVPAAIIDDAVRRILRTKFCFRLDTDPPVPNPQLVESRAHTDLAREVAAKAIVLLKNEPLVLPLDRTRIRSLAVVGMLADRANLGDRGSSNVSPSSVITPLAGIRDRAGTIAVAHVAGDPLSADDRATIAAADAAIVVAGLTAEDEGEGKDRTTMDLPADQERLILDVAGLNGSTIVVLEGGSAITTEAWVDHVEALLMAWYPGQEGGSAIAGVLFGDHNPSGRLPLTFPRSADDLPAFVTDRRDVAYGYYHGYRHLDREGTAPRFPFGFGLSYTTYDYRNLTIAEPTLASNGTVRATVEVTNSGAVAGDETVQLYVSYVGSRVDRPERDLRGFAKVHLEPGETRRVQLEVRAADLAFYDVPAGSWEVEPISYLLHVGPSSRDLPLHASFQVAPPLASSLARDAESTMPPDVRAWRRADDAAP